MRQGIRRLSSMTMAFGAALLWVVAVWLPAEETRDQLYVKAAREFLATPEGGGEQNALSNYLRAFEMFDVKAFAGKASLFKEMVKRAWTASDAQEVQTLQQVQPVLNEIWRGNEKPMIKHIPWRGGNTPIPNFLKCQILGELLILEANYCDFIGKTDFAITWQKHALLFSQRLCDEQKTGIIAKLISMKLEEQCFENLQRFLVQRALTTAQYQQIINDLQQIEKSEIPLWRAIDAERRSQIDMILNMDKFIEEAKKSASPDAAQRQIVQEMQAIAHNKENFAKRYDEVSKGMLSVLQAPYPAVAKYDFNAVVAKEDPVLQKWLSGLSRHSEARAREGKTRALAGLTQTLAGMQLYRAQKGSYPATLAELSAVMPTVALDPFIEKNFKYTNPGTYRLLYSVGPDMLDNGGTTSYDPTNGTVSSGDIIVRF